MAQARSELRLYAQSQPRDGMFFRVILRCIIRSEGLGVWDVEGRRLVLKA
jgi:hypothetical protein